MNRLNILVAAFLVLVSLSYCGTARRGTPVFKPIAADTPAVAQGEVVYMKYCQKCHPGGAAGLGPAINNKPLPGFTIRYQVRKGVGMMPAFKEHIISDQELNHLMAYLKSLRSAKQEKS